MKCNKCGNEFPKDSIFCQVCGAKVEINESKPVVSSTSYKKNKSINCPQCGKESLEKSKKGFFSVSQRYLCNKCGYSGPLLLNESTRMALTAFTLLLVVGLISSFVSGTPGGVGILGILIISLYIQDIKYRRVANNYREKNNLPQYKSDEKNSLVKGIIYITLIVIFSILVGYALGE